jgi:hypothetical protein
MNQGFSSYFCLLIEGSGSGSIPLTNMDPNSDPGGQKHVNPVDPEHCWTELGKSETSLPLGVSKESGMG